MLICAIEVLNIIIIIIINLRRYLGGSHLLGVALVVFLLVFLQILWSELETLVSWRYDSSTSLYSVWVNRGYNTSRLISGSKINTSLVLSSSCTSTSPSLEIAFCFSFALDYDHWRQTGESPNRSGSYPQSSWFIAHGFELSFSLSS